VINAKINGHGDEMAEVERVRRLEEKSIPHGFDYDNITSSAERRGRS
jgi:tRNA U34 5-carboxymethylaminomethyl modifying enzyme MnmG/GidA